MQVHRDLTVNPQVNFVQTPYFQDLIERALIYLRAGATVHLQGPSGTGKTTCALHLAQQLGRPLILMFGNDQFTPADLTGRHFGFKRKLLIDQYIHSVERREEEITSTWVDGRLLAACKEGYTLVYDEFSRSRPEANNVLIPVLEERILELPPTHHGEKYVKVHPQFRAIFTSNPDEYAGVHHRPDALLDRMITIDLGAIDAESELAIVIARTGLPPADADAVITAIRSSRERSGLRWAHSIRASLLVASILRETGMPAEPGTAFFDRLCQDVLGSAASTRLPAEPATQPAAPPPRRRPPKSSTPGRWETKPDD